MSAASQSLKPSQSIGRIANEAEGCDPIVAETIACEGFASKAVGAEPSLGIEMAAAGIESAAAEEEARAERDVRRPVDRRAGIERLQSRGQRRRIRPRQIGLGDDDPVGDGDLPAGCLVPVERSRPVHGIDGGDEPVDGNRRARRPGRSRSARRIGAGSASPLVSTDDLGGRTRCRRRRDGAAIDRGLSADRPATCSTGSRCRSGSAASLARSTSR